ncbi:MAG: permease-like cell division protein FtsX [Clostridia bacterium]
MKIRTWGYFLKQTMRSVGRNKFMSLAAVMTVTMCLFIVGMFTLLVVNANNLADGLEKNVEIVAYIDVQVTAKELNETLAATKKLQGVQDVLLIDKAAGLEELQKKFGEKTDLMDALGGKNPLPDYLRIKVTNPADVEKIAAEVKSLAKITEVDFGKEAVNKLFAVLDYIRLGGLAIIIFLSIAAVFLVSTTIRITVFSRKKEINVMKLVGASDWFIRWPFFIEGMFLGLVGGLVADIGLYFGYQFILTEFGSTLLFITLWNDPQAFLELLFVLLMSGMLVGAFGSLISVRRFLNV